MEGSREGVKGAGERGMEGRGEEGEVVEVASRMIA